MNEPTLILCLECSTDVCSVALVDETRVISCKESPKNYSHGELITAYIEDVLCEANVPIKRLSAVSISSGPGSYTALRIAATVAKGICYSQKIPLIAIDSLTILSYAASTEIRNDHTIVSMIDARRMEVYSSVYVNGQQKLLPTAIVVEEDSLQQYVDKETLYCGDGIQKTMDTLGISPSQVLTHSASARHMHHPSIEKYKKQAFENIAYYSPFYLKSPNITKSKKKLF